MSDWNLIDLRLRLGYFLARFSKLNLSLAPPDISNPGQSSQHKLR